ncbi:hypothetical protein ABK040_010161 [Willaertia magna]
MGHSNISFVCSCLVILTSFVVFSICASNNWSQTNQNQFNERKAPFTGSHPNFFIPLDSNVTVDLAGAVAFDALKGRLYFLTDNKENLRNGPETINYVDLASGKLIKTNIIIPQGNGINYSIRPHAMVDNQGNLYFVRMNTSAIFTSFNVIKVDTGKWQTSYLYQSGNNANNEIDAFAISQERNIMVLVMGDHYNAVVKGIDLQTGRELWSSSKQREASFTSIILSDDGFAYLGAVGAAFKVDISNGNIIGGSSVESYGKHITDGFKYVVTGGLEYGFSALSKNTGSVISHDIKFYPLPYIPNYLMTLIKPQLILTAGSHDLVNNRLILNTFTIHSSTFSAKVSPVWEHSLFEKDKVNQCYSQLVVNNNHDILAVCDIGIVVIDSNTGNTIRIASFPAGLKPSFSGDAQIFSADNNMLYIISQNTKLNNRVEILAMSLN